MEKLADSGLLAGVIDVTTTEVCDLLMGGVFSAGEDRFGAVIRTRLPYVGSCGALDMVNFGPLETVPERYKGRNLYRHNPQVTLMRTTAEENERMGRLDRRAAEPDGRPGALPHSRGRRLAARPARRALSGIPRPMRRCSRRSGHGAAGRHAGG